MEGFKELENGYERLQEIAKSMTTEELIELWEDSLQLPQDEPIPEFIPVICAELVAREELKP